MELVAGGIENSQPGMGQASLQFFTARDRDHLVLAAVQDQYGLPDVAQAIANVVMPDGLVLANDRVERHLAKALGVLGHPLGVVENEMWLVERGCPRALGPRLSVRPAARHRNGSRPG